MTEARMPTITQSSPDFRKAKFNSQILAILLAIYFWGACLLVVVKIAHVIWPETLSSVRGSTSFDGPTVPVEGLSSAQRAALILTLIFGMAPYLLVFHHARRMFARFAKAEFFSGAIVKHVRATGLWMFLASAVAEPVDGIVVNVLRGVSPFDDGLHANAMLLIVGAALQVVAFVMAEARRIADDNASFV